MVFSLRSSTVLILGPDWAAAAPFFLIFAGSGVRPPGAGERPGAVLVSRGRSLKLLMDGGSQPGALLGLVVRGAFGGPQGSHSRTFSHPRSCSSPTCGGLLVDSGPELRDFFSRWCDQ